MSEEAEQIEQIARCIDANAFVEPINAGKEYRQKAARNRAGQIAKTFLSWFRDKPDLTKDGKADNCPFCNVEPEIYSAVAPDGFSPWSFIRCVICGIEMSDEYLWELLERWNTRKMTASHQASKLLDAVRQARLQFAYYVDQHMDKIPALEAQKLSNRLDYVIAEVDKQIADTTAKAEVNREFVQMMDEAMFPDEEDRV